MTPSTITIPIAREALTSLPSGLNIPSFTSVLGQVPGTVVDSPEEAAMVFSGPHFFIALIAGIALAFAFQFLLTNLGVAAGVSLAGGSSDSSTSKSDKDLGDTISKIGFVLGLTTLITVVISLFCATWLAVQLSLLVSPGLGAIVGLVIWAAYFSLLLWISSTTVGSFVGSVVNTATSGIQSLFGAATSVFHKDVGDKMVASAEAAAAAVRHELTSTVDSDYVQEQLEDYIRALRSPNLDMAGLRSEFEAMIDESGVTRAGSGEELPALDREDFVKLVEDRTDLSRRDRDRIADQLYAVWSRRASRYQSEQSHSELKEYIQRATAEQLTGPEFERKLDQLIEAVQQDHGTQQQPKQDSGSITKTVGRTAERTLSPLLNSMAGMAVGRADLSDLSVEKILNKINTAQAKLSEQKDKLPVGDDTPYNVIREDAKAYLINTPHWRMTLDRVAREFRDIIYDPDADPEVASYQLNHISRSDFVDWLGQRGLFTQDEIQKRADTLESVRIEALSAAEAALTQQQVINLLEEVQAYLLNTPTTDLTPEKIQLSFKPILRDRDASEAQLSARLSRLDRSFFTGVFDVRMREHQDITADQVNSIIMYLEKARDEVIAEAADNQKAVQARATDQWDKVKAFLRETDRRELDPDAVERELSLLLDDPQAGLAALRARASMFNRDTLVQMLNQRQDLSEEEINTVIDQVERRWHRVRYAPKQLAGQAQAQYDEAMTALTNYLRNTDRDELNPKGIRQDLTLLLDKPELGLKAIRARLAEVDRGTLVALMAQRQDLSEAEANQIIDEVIATLREIARMPRRAAHRVQQRAQSFQEDVEEYLRSTNKEELHPEGIKRDLSLLLNEPRAGMGNLSDRLAHVDRTTVAALLAQRDDMSREEANRVVNQVMSVKDELAYQMQRVQQRIQAMVNRLLAQVRIYLNSLDRPELEYEGIKRDVRTLFDDPGAGFDALRARLGRFNRDTLVAVVSSNDRISEADAYRVIDQVESARNSVLQQAEYVQREAQLKLEQMKHQAAHQAEETRKAAAAASWWLFLTALISAIASAGAGALGVIS